MRKITKKHAVSQNIEVTNCFCCHLRVTNMSSANVTFNGVHRTGMCVCPYSFTCWGYKTRLYRTHKLNSSWTYKPNSS